MCGYPNTSVSPSVCDPTTWCMNGSWICYVLFRSCPQEHLKRPPGYAAQLVPTLSGLQGPPQAGGNASWPKPSTPDLQLRPQGRSPSPAVKSSGILEDHLCHYSGHDLDPVIPHSPVTPALKRGELS